MLWEVRGRRADLEWSVVKTGSWGLGLKANHPAPAPGFTTSKLCGFGQFTSDVCLHCPVYKNEDLIHIKYVVSTQQNSTIIIPGVFVVTVKTRLHRFTKQTLKWSPKYQVLSTLIS